MASNNNTKPKKIKYSVKVGVELNEEQRNAIDVINKNTIVYLKGKSGSGKTMTACYYAINSYLSCIHSRIIITRPNVYKNSIGYLKGTLEEKMAPWMAPIYDNMNIILNKQTIDDMVNDGKIVIIPFEYMRGRSFLDATVIVDEVQNLEVDDLLNVITRTGLNSKLILCGDVNQIDLPKSRKSCMSFLDKLCDNIEGFKSFSLEKNHRHPIVDEILKFVDTYNE